MAINDDAPLAAASISPRSPGSWPMPKRDGAVPGQGTFFFMMSALACLVLFGSTTAAIGVLVLAVLDSVTALAGMTFGRHPPAPPGRADLYLGRG